MCSAPETVAAGLYVLLLLCVCVAVAYESRFMAHLENHHSGLWRDLASHSGWLMPEDGNYSYAGAQWHLILRGGYKSIDDAALQTLGFKARLVSLTMLASVAILGVFAMVVQSFPSPVCLVAWAR